MVMHARMKHTSVCNAFCQRIELERGGRKECGSAAWCAEGVRTFSTNLSVSIGTRRYCYTGMHACMHA